MEESWNFIFWSKYFMLFKNCGKRFPCNRVQIGPKKVGFSACFSHRKLKLVVEKSLRFIAKFLCEHWFFTIHVMLGVNQISISDFFALKKGL